MSWQTSIYRELNTRLDRILGGKTATSFEKLGLYTVGDLLAHQPRRYISGTDISDFTKLRVDDEVALIARVHAVEQAYGRKHRVKVTLTDDHGGYISATFFADKEWLIKHWVKILTKGVRGIFVGKVGEFRGQLQLAHPDFVLFDDNNNIVAGKDVERKKALVKQVQRDTLVGIYPASKALPTWIIADSVALALEMASSWEDPLPTWILDRANVIDLASAYQAVHAPITRQEAETGLARLRFGEALMTQLALAYRRFEREQLQISTIQGGQLLAAFDAQLPFSLTEGQQNVSAEIFADLARQVPMSRLLQGEVGSGKTVVALRAMLAAVDSGGQAALLAPTEVLAKQHYRTITKLLGELAVAIDGVEVSLLTASRSAAAKRDAQEKLANGQIGIVVGTHALLSQGVKFQNLNLVVVDEQHRFGVEQRAALATKAETEPHTLVMTATPIPRSVAMTIFGDLTTSSLKQLPSGRAEVKTVFVNTAQHPHWVTRAWERAKEEVAQGRQVFIVCPRIDPDDDSSTDDFLEEIPNTRTLTAVTQLVAELQSGPLADLKIAAVHGKQPAAERDEIMVSFAAGELDVLVATTVVEVGVDIPNSSMMIIVDADRFGLSQLHQLRGRIGRGSHAGLCLLLAPVTDPESVANKRLQAMVDSRDGFELAETDLQLRREGNVLGAEQSGTTSGLKLLRVLEDVETIQLSKDIAEQVVTQDPTKSQPWVSDTLRQVAELEKWASRS